MTSYEFVPKGHFFPDMAGKVQQVLQRNGYPKSAAESIYDGWDCEKGVNVIIGEELSPKAIREIRNLGFVYPSERPEPYGLGRDYKWSERDL